MGCHALHITMFSAGTALVLSGAAALAEGPDTGPGVIVHQLPVPSLLERALGRAVYTASPSIAVLPNGDYLISSNPFGRGSGADRSGTTFLHRSRDRGASWHLLAALRDMKRGSLFRHGADLYLWGYTAAPGSIVIRRSTDGGEAWTEPIDDRSGLLRPGRFGGTPCSPVVHNGRLWIAQGGKRVMSAAAEADLLRADSWTLSGAADTDSGPLGSGLTVTEAQVVAAPHTGVVLLPKVHGRAYTVLLRVGNDPGTLLDPATDDWISFPGGEKKFAVRYDPAAETFYALSNPVLPEDAGRGWPPELVRNTLALLTSKDLRAWRLERMVLHSQNVDYEAFQYPSFAIEGDDLLVALRTAFDVDGTKPPRGHDSNLITFFRIEGFRTCR